MKTDELKKENEKVWSCEDAVAHFKKKHVKYTDKNFDVHVMYLIAKKSDWHPDLYLSCEYSQYDIQDREAEMYEYDQNYVITDLTGQEKYYHIRYDYWDWNFDTSGISELICFVEELSQNSLDDVDPFFPLIESLLPTTEYKVFSSGSPYVDGYDFVYYFFKNVDEFKKRLIEKLLSQYADYDDIKSALDQIVYEEEYPSENFLSHAEFVKFLRSLPINSPEEYSEWWVKNRPKNVPRLPELFYNKPLEIKKTLKIYRNKNGNFSFVSDEYASNKFFAEVSSPEELLEKITSTVRIYQPFKKERPDWIERHGNRISRNPGGMDFRDHGGSQNYTLRYANHDFKKFTDLQKEKETENVSQ